MIWGLIFGPKHHFREINSLPATGPAQMIGRMLMQRGQFLPQPMGRLPMNNPWTLEVGAVSNAGPSPHGPKQNLDSSSFEAQQVDHVVACLTILGFGPCSNFSGSAGCSSQYTAQVPPAKFKDFVCNTIGLPPQHPIPPLVLLSIPWQLQDLPDILNHFFSCDKFFYHQKNILAAVTTISEPARNSEAITDPICRIAVKKEIDALEQYQTLIIISLPPGKRTRCKWVQIIKYKVDGMIERYKFLVL